MIAFRSIVRKARGPYLSGTAPEPRRDPASSVGGRSANARPFAGAKGDCTFGQVSRTTRSILRFHLVRRSPAGRGALRRNASWSRAPVPRCLPALFPHLAMGVPGGVKGRRRHDHVVTCPSGSPRSIANIMLALGLRLFDPAKAVLQNVTGCYIFRIYHLVTLLKISSAGRPLGAPRTARKRSHRAAPTTQPRCEQSRTLENKAAGPPLEDSRHTPLCRSSPWGAHSRTLTRGTRHHRT
jgi:hypothetical protein